LEDTYADQKETQHFAYQLEEEEGMLVADLLCVGLYFLDRDVVVFCPWIVFCVCQTDL
jgi:hypothetical protein